MNKFNSILNKTKEIKNFRVFDVDDEWNLFKPLIHQELSNISDLPNDNLQRFNKETSRQVVFLLSFAASLILIFACISFFSSTQKVVDSLTTDSETDSIRLIDGSLVLLLPHSKLDYYLSLNHAKERSLHLKGDAEFDISASILPLKVYHDSILVEVLGTKFSIRKVNDSIEIKNTSGSVKVSEINNAENTRILKKGDTYYYSNGKFINPADSLFKPKSDISPSPEKVKKTKPAEEVTPGSIYLLKSVIKNHILKYNKKKIKLGKKIKLDYNARVRLDLSKSYLNILEDLKKQGFIDFKKGDCPDCIIITSPNKN